MFVLRSCQECFSSSHLLVGALSLTSGWRTRSPQFLCAAEWRRSTPAETAGTAGRRSAPRHEAPWERCWPGLMLHAGAADCSPPAHHHRLTTDRNNVIHRPHQPGREQYHLGIDWVKQMSDIILPLDTTTIHYHNVTEVQFQLWGLSLKFCINRLGITAIYTSHFQRLKSNWPLTNSFMFSCCLCHFLSDVMGLDYWWR